MTNQINALPHEEGYYTRTSKSIDDWTGENVRGKLLKFLSDNAKPGQKILEVGCGGAELLHYLPKESFYTGCDISDYAIARSRESWSGRENTLFMKNNEDALPLEEKSCDFIISVFAIEHVRNPRKLLGEMERVLKPGGYILLAAPNLELPVSSLNGIRHKSSFYKTWFSFLRICDYLGRIFGKLRFRVIKENYTEKTGLYRKPDDDLRYVASAWEVASFLSSLGLKAVFISRYSGSSLLKKIITKFPCMEYYGTELCLIFNKKAE